MRFKAVKNIFRSTFDKYSHQLDPGIAKALRISIRMALTYRGWLLMVFFGGTISALLEGLTLGGLYLGLTALTEGADSIIEKIPESSPEFVYALLKFLDGDDIFLIFVGIAICSQLLKAVSDYLVGVAGVTLSIKMKSYMQDETVKRIMSIDYSQVMRYPAGRLVTLVNESEKVTAIVDEGVQMFRVGIMLVTYLAIVLALSLAMASITGLVIVVFWFFVNWVLKKIRPLIDSVVENQIETGRWTVEYLSYPRILRIFGSEDYASDRIRKSRNLWLTTLLRAERIRVLVEPLLESVTIIAAGAILLGGYFLAGENATSFVPKLFIFVGAFLRMRPLIKYLNDFRLRIVEVVAYLKKIGGFFYETDPQISSVSSLMTKKITDRICFENVSYSYPDMEGDVIKSASFEIPVGKTTAIVGPTGSGKSTLVDLLIGLISPTCGSIMVDDKCLDMLDQMQWRKSLGVVDQEVVLTSSSIKDNISFGNSDVTDQDVYSAVEIASANEFIDQLDDGMETLVGDRGFKLSGGQRQRIALARAIARDPDILILDEATSSLDNLSEKMIQNALDNLRGTRTIIVIAHRLTTIKHADDIIVLDKGVIVEQGNWEELIRAGGLFFEMAQKR